MNLTEKKNNFIAADRTINDYLKEIGRYKVLSTSEERELVKEMVNGSEEARQTLINCNLRFVYKIAKNYANEDNLKDLINEGNMGLMQALV